MKKIIFIAIILMSMFLYSCEESKPIKPTEPTYGEYDILSVVEVFGNYTLLVDKDTKVLYVTNQYKGSIEVLLNADGTPKLWKGIE